VECREPGSLHRSTEGSLSFPPPFLFFSFFFFFLILPFFLCCPLADTSHSQVVYAPGNGYSSARSFALLLLFFFLGRPCGDDSFDITGVNRDARVLFPPFFFFFWGGRLMNQITRSSAEKLPPPSSLSPPLDYRLLVSGCKTPKRSRFLLLPLPFPSSVVQAELYTLPPPSPFPLHFPLLGSPKEMMIGLVFFFLSYL